jgi:hypothetical protein
MGAVIFSTDVINVSGHRLSTAEIESALIQHKGIAETAGMRSDFYTALSATAHSN